MGSSYATPEEIFETKKKTAVPMMWLGLVGIIMFFGGLTSAYVVRQAQGDWLYFDIPQIFFVSTGVIVASSFTMFFAQFLAKKGQVKAAAMALLATLGLGITFIVMQYMGFMDLVDMGVYFTGRESNASGSFFDILVWAHVAHVIGGLVALIFTSVKALLGMYSAEDHIGITVCGIYWHFLDILWIYLILFLVFIR